MESYCLTSIKLDTKTHTMLKVQSVLKNIKLKDYIVALLQESAINHQNDIEPEPVNIIDIVESEYQQYVPKDFVKFIEETISIKFETEYTKDELYYAYLKELKANKKNDRVSKLMFTKYLNKYAKHNNLQITTIRKRGKYIGLKLIAIFTKLEDYNA